MPNWCDTTYKCVGDLKEVRSLYRILKYIDNRKTPIVPNGFGNRWLGNLVTKLGGNWESCRCRGEILDYHIDGNVLTIYQSTAWCEQEGVREIIEKAYPSIKVYYREEEPGCEVYCTNDSSGTYFPDRYYLDAPCGDSEYFETIEDAVKYITELIGKEVEPNKKAIDTALEEYTKLQDDEDICYYFHEYDVIE